VPPFRLSHLLSRVGGPRLGATPLPYFFLLLLLIGFGMAIARGVSNSLFLKRYGVEFLPVIFLIQGLTLGTLSLVYATVADRYRPESVMKAILLIVIGTVMALWIAARMGAPDIVWGMVYLLYVTASETLAMHATLYVGATFFGEQAKRLAPIAFAGGPLGDVLGGLALIAMAPMFGTETTALLWPMFLAISLALIAFHHRRDAVSPRSGARSKRLAQTLRQLRQGREFLKRSPLLRHVSLSVMYSVIAVFISAYLFKDIFARTVRDAESLAYLYGVIIVVSGASAFLLQTGLVPSLIRTFGLRRVNLVFPVTLLGVLLAFLTPWALLAATAASYNRYVLLAAVRNPVRVLMLQALPDAMQGRVRALALVVMTPAAMIASGIVLFLWRDNVPVVTAIGIAAALLSLRSAWLANRAYADALIATLRDRHFVTPDQIGGWNAQGSEKMVAALCERLRAEDPDDGEKAARLLLEHFPHAAVTPIINYLHQAPIPQRDRLAHAVAPHLAIAQRDSLYDALFDGDPHAQATALTIALRNGWPPPWERTDPARREQHVRLLACRWVEELGEGSGSGSVAVLRAALLDPGSPRWYAVLGTLAQAPRRPALPLLLESLDAAPDDTTALTILNTLAAQKQPLPPSLAPRLHQLLRGTGDVFEQGILLRAVECLPSEQQIPLLLGLLESHHPKVGADATAALHACLPTGLGETLLAAIDQGTLSILGQDRAIEILGRQPDPRLLSALAARYAADAGRHAALAAHFAGDALPPMRLMRIALEERALDLRRLGLAAVGTGALRDLARTLRASLGSTDARLVARCTELIELVPDTGSRDILLDLFLAPRGGAGAMSAAAAATAIDALRHGRDAWLARCANQWSTNG